MARRAFVIVSGPPGAGKTTVARLVAERYDNAICVESDWFWTTVIKGFIPPWKPDADAQNRVIVRSCAAACAAMAAGGYAVVLDGIIGPWNLDILAEELGAQGVSADYFVLRPSRAIALARATGRAGDERTPGHPALTDEAPILHMWNKFSDLGPYEDRVIDNSYLTSEETAETIWKHLGLTDL